MTDSSSMPSPLLDRGANALIGGGMVPSPQTLQMVPTGSSSQQQSQPMNLNMGLNMNLNMNTMNMNLNGNLNHFFSTKVNLFKKMYGSLTSYFKMRPVVLKEFI